MKANTISRAEYRAILRSVAAPTQNETRVARRPVAWWAILIAGNCGLRVGEVAALRCGDVKLGVRPPVLTVRTLKQRRPASDDVMIAEGLRRQLARLLEAREAAMQRAPGYYDHAAPLLPGRGGRGRVSVRGLQHAFRAAVKRAGIERPDGWRLSFHALRHFHGSAYYAETLDVAATALRLRQRKAETAEIYIHADPERVRQTLETIEEV